MIGAGTGPAGRRRVVRREVRLQRSLANRISYSEARPDFRVGDVLLFRGRGLASQVIRLLTRSPYSHVGVVFLFGARVYCLEAVGTGVRLILMSEVVRRYHGGIDYYELVNATPQQRSDAVSFCFEQLGKLYDKPGILRFGAALLFNRKPTVREDQAWFCSELVAAAYRKHGLPLVAESAAYTSPADLAVSPELELRYIVKRG